MFSLLSISPFHHATIKNISYPAAKELHFENKNNLEKEPVIRLICSTERR